MSELCPQERSSETNAIWCWLAIAIVAVFVLPGAAAQVAIDQRQDTEEVAENSREAHLV